MNSPQPPATQAADSGETRKELYRITGFGTPQYVESIGMLGITIPAGRFEPIIDELEQQLAAAVQAAQVELLEGILSIRFKSEIDMRDWIAGQRDMLEAALLNQERRKEGEIRGIYER